MRITPKSDEAIAKEREKFEPLKGIFDFDVMEANDQISRSGNDMIKVKLSVYRPAGGELHVYDYLLDAMSHKIKHFCEATGLTDRYEAGDLNSSDCQNRSGKVELCLEKDSNGNDRSVVKDYVKNAAKAKASTAKPIDPELDDDIPF